MMELARKFDVTDRTIRTDITILTVDYPLETVRGNGGGVKVADWYHPNKNIFSRRQQTVLVELLYKADERQKKILCEILFQFGSSDVKKMILDGDDNDD